MGLFKPRDKARKREQRDLHDSAFAAAKQSYHFWGRDVSIAYEEYCKRMQDYGARPVSRSRFREELTK